MPVYSAAAACNGEDVTTPAALGRTSAAVVFLNNGAQTSVWLLFWPTTPSLFLQENHFKKRQQKTGANHVRALDALIHEHLIVF